VTDAPISDRRIRFLENHKIAVGYEDGNGLVECGTLAQRLLELAERVDTRDVGQETNAFRTEAGVHSFVP
jgi:hypothetical protein